MNAVFQTPVPTDFLRDESRKSGAADAIVFPRTTADVVDAVREAAARRWSVTVQGARTGISAGAVPEGGLILNLSKMDRILGPIRTDANGTPVLSVESGLPLVALRRHLAALGRTSPTNRSYLFTPDPTETSASLGGMAACNASGACSFAYGPSRNHIAGLAVVLADGDTLRLRRGEHFAQGHRFSLTTDGGRVLAGDLPRYALPAVKNAAGYWTHPGMDLIDLFIGCEGTLGIVTDLDLRLTPKPRQTLGLVCFLPAEQQALDFVAALRAQTRPTAASPQFPASSVRSPATLVALEYFDAGSLALIRASAPHTGLLLPPIRPDLSCALYAEWALESDSDEPLARTSRLLAACGGHAEDVWLAADAPSLEKLKAFRHAVPEQVNAIIAERKRSYPALTKLGTDLSVPDDRLHDVMRLYRDDLRRADLEHVVFGHIGNNHVHVNILPRDMEDYARGKALYRAWAQQVVAWGGSVSAEHGIGRLKKDLLAVMYGPDGIDAMRRLKALFDPDHRLNPGRLF